MQGLGTVRDALASLAGDFKGVVKEEAKDIANPKASKAIGADAALKKAKNEQERFYAFGAAAKKSFNNGNYAGAKA